MTSTTNRSGPATDRRWGAGADAAAAVLAPLVLAGLGAVSGIVGNEGSMAWYQSLNQPWFTPPGAAFGIAWTILYILMGIAFWRVIRLAPGAERDGPRRRAIGLFLVQLALNLVWNPAFFLLQSPLVGVILIVPLLVLIALTVHAFRRVDRLAAALLLPYLAWVTFATVLSVSILVMN
ncbi:TspO/MBR family protein [Fodinicurvata sp. EGI_FJ10296]|uniref:TspO/MBR family protein n=1 Tax=Fodinicurvata sp. EGI_FJ10296 TaxID=3231908 RepID=UPI0034555067